MLLGTHLAQLRTRSGLTQQAVGDALGCVRFTVSKIETGRTLPSSRQLDRYLDAVSATPEERLRALELAGAETLPDSDDVTLDEPEAAHGAAAGDVEAA
jgi:transcriptional regulator with XRE-family HTH domain